MNRLQEEEDLLIYVTNIHFNFFLIVSIYEQISWEYPFKKWSQYAYRRFVLNPCTALEFLSIADRL